MIEIQTWVALEADQNPDSFARHEEHGILPAIVDVAGMSDTTAFQDLELFPV